jgi:hypothetical protein
MAIKKYFDMHLRFIYDSQARNRKQGGRPVRDLLPRHTPQTGGTSYILIEKYPTLESQRSESKCRSL